MQADTNISNLTRKNKRVRDGRVAARPQTAAVIRAARVRSPGAAGLLARVVEFPLYFPYPMAQLLALYHQPADPAAFDRYYFETHVPIAKRVPGLRSYVVNDGPLNAIAGSPAPYLIAELGFDSMADLQSALSSAEGQAAAADLSNFAQAGVTLIVFETKSA